MKRRVRLTGSMVLMALIALTSAAISGFNPIGGGTLKTGTLTSGKACTWDSTAGLVCTSDVVTATPIDDNSSRTQTSVGLTTTVFSTRAIMAWVRTFFMPSASVDTWAKTDGNDTEARRLMGVVAGTGDLKADGTIPLTADWDAGNYAFTGKSFTAKRTDAPQTLKLYESTSDGNDSITVTVPPKTTGLAADGTVTFNKSLAFTGTMTGGDLCKYTASGTVISCDVPFIDRIGASFDGGGSAIALNKVAYTTVPYGATVNQWTVICDQNGTTGAIIDVLKIAYTSNTLPTDTMCGTGTKPHVDDGNNKTNQANWDCATTTITAGDVLAFKVTTAPSNATWCNLTLKVTRN